MRRSATKKPLEAPQSADGPAREPAHLINRVCHLQNMFPTYYTVIVHPSEMFFQYLVISVLLCACTGAHSTECTQPPLSRRQSQNASQECHLLVPTDVWTTCSDILNTYDVSLPDFVEANTGLGSNCAGFAPGKPYCVAQAIEYSVTVSNDSRCGVQKNWTNTCVGSTYGDCWYDLLYHLVLKLA